MNKLIIILIAVFYLASCGGDSGGGGKASEIEQSNSSISENAGPQESSGRRIDRFYSSNDCLFNISDDQIFYDAFAQFGRLYKVAFNYSDDYMVITLTDVADAPGPFMSSIAFNRDGLGLIDVLGEDVQKLSHQQLDFSGQCAELLTEGKVQTKTFFNVNKADFIPVEVSSGVFVGPNASYYPLERKTNVFSRAVFTRDGVLYSHKNYIAAGILVDDSSKLVIASSLGVTVLNLQ